MKAETIRTPISIDRIAPTLASVMRIRAPNASTASPLTFDSKIICANLDNLYRNQ